jgi:adenylate kinase family enzyme
VQKVAIIGSSGAGKTTLGRALSARINAASVDLDELNWEPGWTNVSHAEFDARLQEALKAPRWVVSGNYRRVQETYLTRADTLIWLDYSFPVVLWRICARTFRRNVFREPCCNGNFESLSRTLSRDSVVLWLFKTHALRQRQSLRLFEPDVYEHLHKLRFRTPRQTQKWLDSL